MVRAGGFLGEGSGESELSEHEELGCAGCRCGGGDSGSFLVDGFRAVDGLGLLDMSKDSPALRVDPDNVKLGGSGGRGWLDIGGAGLTREVAEDFAVSLTGEGVAELGEAGFEKGAPEVVRGKEAEACGCLTVDGDAVTCTTRRLPI